MKIVLLGNYRADRQQSMLRYADFLFAQLTARGHQVRRVSPPVVFRRFVNSEHRLSKWLGYLDKYLLFRLSIRWQIGQADVVHVCDHSNAPYLHWIKGARRLITCHDALAILSARGLYAENQTRATGRKLQEWILRGFKSADHIIYVSEKTREDFEQKLGVHAPSDVIPHSLHWTYRAAKEQEMAEVLRVCQVQHGQYLLHVGSNVWYKNRPGVLKAFTAILKEPRFAHLRLVMAGEAFNPELERWVREQGLTQVVSFVSPSNEQLRCLYSGALAFLFPSLQEGFGWPLLEAQACQCPVITANRAPMTEITGGSAIYYDPERPEEAVAALDEVVKRREDLIGRGEQNLKRFTAEAMMAHYETVYQTLAEQA